MIRWGKTLLVSVASSLRIVDPPRPCHGYQNGCICPACQDRVERTQRLRERLQGKVSAEAVERMACNIAEADSREFFHRGEQPWE